MPELVFLFVNIKILLNSYENTLGNLEKNANLLESVYLNEYKFIVEVIIKSQLHFKEKM